VIPFEDRHPQEVAIFERNGHGLPFGTTGEPARSDPLHAIINRPEDDRRIGPNISDDGPNPLGNVSGAGHGEPPRRTDSPVARDPDVSSSIDQAPDRPSTRSELSLRPLILRMRPEFRRSAIYVLAAMALIPTIRWLARDWLPAREPDGQAILLGIWSLMALGPIGVLRWRLRIDGRGIARRRLLGWDLWPWDAFEQSRVLDGEDDGAAYLLPEKPRWSRKLSLDLLDPDDHRLVADILGRIRVRPPAPAAPGEVHVRYGFGREAFIGPRELILVGSGEARSYAWDAVRLLRIRRRDHDRLDFSSLEIELPDQTVAFRITHQHGQAIRSWSTPRGSDPTGPEVLAEALARYVPTDRVLISALSGPPRTRAEWLARRAQFEKRAREFVVLRRIFLGAGALLVHVILAYAGAGWWPTSVYLVLIAVQWSLFWAILLHAERLEQRSRAELESCIPDDWRREERAADA
jgi:hypothetical protein